MTPNMITTNGNRGLMGGFPGAKRMGGGPWLGAAGDRRLLLIIAIFSALSRRKSSQTYAAVTDGIAGWLKINKKGLTKAGKYP